MHWGVRRYQNPDGTLTAAGRARLKKTKKFESTKNRDEANKWYKDQNNKALKEATGSTEWTGDGYEFTKAIGEEKAAEIWNKYLDKIAEAKIKDVGLTVSKEAVDYVNKIMGHEDERLRKVHFIDGNGKEFTDYLDNNTMNDQEYQYRMRGFVKYEDGDPKAAKYQRVGTIRRDKNLINDQVTKELTNDLNRWKNEGSKDLRNKDISKLSKKISEELKDQLELVDDYDIALYDFNKDDKEINFNIGGLKSYQGGDVPLTIVYDPDKKKVTDIYYT